MRHERPRLLLTGGRRGSRRPVGVTATRQRQGGSCNQKGAASPPPPAAEEAELKLREPGEPTEEEDHRDIEVEPESKDVMRRVDPQELLPDPGERVTRHVDGEESGRPDAAMVTEPDQDPGEPEIPDQLIEEGGLEGRELFVARRPVCWINLQAPGQARRATEELLVEVVADPADRLAHQETRRGGVQEPGDVGATVAQDQQAGGRAGRDAAPDPEPAIPDREWPPPVRRHQVRAGQIEIEAPSHDPGREGPEGDLVDQGAIAPFPLPAANDDRDCGGQGEHVSEAVGVDQERSEV